MTTRPLLVPGALLALLLTPAPTAPRDLDVGIPPGSPTSWGRRFPAITPRRGPLFPLTQPAAGAAGEAANDPRRTVSQGPTTPLDAGVASSFGIVRILTWDLTAHLPWTAGGGVALAGPTTGRSSKEPPLPRPGDALYWACTAALLRLLLHPQLVSEPELLAHLIEIGEPTLAVLDSAATEPALEPACKELRKRIERKRALAPPVAGRTPRETMLSRLVADELVIAHPYDPEGTFCRRAFLFGATMLPHLAAYLDHADPFVRRNAAAALGRYADPAAAAALLGAAARTDDPVVLMRALAGIGDNGLRGDPTPLVQRLDEARRADDAIATVALLECLGRIRAPEARPRLLELGDKGARGDPGLLQAVLAAMVRCANGPGDEDFAAFALRVRRLCQNLDRFEVKRSEPAPAADRPDTGKTRGEVIEQLVLLLRAKLQVRGAAQRVLELLGEAREPRPGRRLPVASRTLERVHPPVQILFLETLRLLDEPGAAALRRIALDDTTEASLRGFALAQLPEAQRGELAADLCADALVDAEMRGYALDVLDRDGHERLRDIARDLVASCRRTPPGGGGAAQRHLWLAAVRALDRRGWNEPRELARLLDHLLPAKRAPVDVAERARRRVRQLVQRLLQDAVADLRSASAARIDEIVTLVIESDLNDDVTATTREKARDEVRRMLEGLPGHRADLPYQQAVERAVLTFLLGDGPVSAADPSRFEPPVLLEEEVLFALGRTRSPEAVAALRAFLTDRPGHSLRAEACLAAGMTGDATLARDLVQRLIEDDGFVRLCAYEALRHLTRQDFQADWLYGTIEERGKAAQDWFRWCAKAR